MSGDEQNRREHERVDVTFRVAYNSLDSLVVGYTQNISKGGLFIHTDHLLPLNSVIRVLIVLPEDGGELGCIGRVVHVRGPGEASPERPAGLAIRFLDLPDATIRAIEDFIARKTSAEAEARTAPKRRLSILVVDDEPRYREQAAEVLRGAGHQVSMCEDGLQALAACLKQPPDLVLSDVQMPRMDGWNFLRTIRARPSLASVLFIFQTSLSSEEERLKGYRLGVDDYLGKPYQPEELLARIDRLVARTMGREPSPASKALRGDLELVSMSTVLSMLELEEKTGVLLVVGPATGRVFVRLGRPVAVEIDGSMLASPFDMAAEILGWKKGQFEFAAQDVSCADQIETSMQGLMMEAARIVDEAKR